MENKLHTILLGTHDKYIHTVQFDQTGGTLTHLHRIETSQDPSWLIRHPVIPDIIYSNGHVEGKVFCYRLNADKSLELLDEAISGDGGPTHLAVMQDQSALLIAHYGKETGTLASLPLDPSTGRFLTHNTIPQQSFKPPYTPNSHPRFNAPHVHQVLVLNDETIICDLGNNKVWRLRLGKEDDQTRWVVRSVIEDFEVDDGPRHAVVHPNGRIIYVLNEISSYLSVRTLPTEGQSTLISRHPIRPPHDLETGDMLGAEIILLPPFENSNKSLLILTNRFSKHPKGDALALFGVADDGSIEGLDQPFYFGIGRHIRALGHDSTSRFIVTAARDHGGVVILERIEDGLKLREVARLGIPNVVVPLWL